MVTLNMPYYCRRQSANVVPGILTRLNLYGVRLNKERLSKFTSQSHHLLYLNLGNTRSDIEMILDIVSQLQLTSLTAINLSNNWLGQSCSMQDYIMLFRQLPSLSKLNINSNELGDDGLNELLCALRRFPNITSLKISDNGIGHRGANILRTALKSMHLTEVEFFHNQICSQDKKIIDQCLEYNRLVSCFFNQLKLGSTESIMFKLRTHPKLLTVRTADGLLPIAVAVQHENFATVKVLLSSGSSVIKVDAANKTLLDFARDHVSSEFFSVLTYLLKVNLLEAVKSDDLEKTKVLSQQLEYTVFLVRGNHQTLLHVAVEHDKQSVVPYLVHHYPVIFLKDGDDKIAFDYLKLPEQQHLCTYFECAAIKSIQTCLTEADLELLKTYLATSLGAYLLEHHQLPLMTLAQRMPDSQCALYLESQVQQHHVTHDAKMFDAIFSSKRPYKSLRIPGNDTHWLLASQVAMWRAQHPVTRPPDTHNLATLRISFIVTNIPHLPAGDHGRQLITIDLNLDPTVLHIENFHQFGHFQKDSKKYLRSPTFFAEVKQAMPLAAHPELEVLYHNPKPTNKFVREFHHSERAMYAYLNQPHIIESICNQLLSKLNLSRSHHGFKVYAMVFDLHTYREICPHCEHSVPQWFGPQSTLLLKFKEALLSFGFKLSTKHTGLASLVRVSSCQSLGASAPLALTSAAQVEGFDMNRPKKAQGVALLKKKLTPADGPGTTIFSNYSEKKRHASLGMLPSHRSS